MILDQNGKRIRSAVRRDTDGTWSIVQWQCAAGGIGINPKRRYGYRTRGAARQADISETVSQTNLRVCGRT